MNHLIAQRNPYRPSRHLFRSIHTKTVRPWQALVPNRNRRRALVCLYVDCLLPPGAQTGQHKRSTRAHCSRNHSYLRPEILGYKHPGVVHGT